MGIGPVVDGDDGQGNLQSGGFDTRSRPHSQDGVEGQSKHCCANMSVPQGQSEGSGGSMQ